MSADLVREGGGKSTGLFSHKLSRQGKSRGNLLDLI